MSIDVLARLTFDEERWIGKLRRIRLVWFKWKVSNLVAQDLFRQSFKWKPDLELVLLRDWVFDFFEVCQ